MHVGLLAGTQAAALLWQVLETDAGNVKALYRRAQAYLASQDYVEAEQVRLAPSVLCSCNRDLTCAFIRQLIGCTDRHAA